MTRPGRTAIVLGGLELVAGSLLILHARTLLPADSAVPIPAQYISGEGPTGPVADDAQRRQSARKIAQNLIAPSQLDVSQIQRIEPRPPLGELGLASHPKTPMLGGWREMLLYRPAAISSAIFESMGRTVAISGVEGIGPDKTCSFRDVAWPCGQCARAAFNSWLRGRALKCLEPPEIDRFAIAAPCKLGKQDVGAWLVSNGWASALASGIYGKSEATARAAEMGIFGTPQ
ncbi:thermonuclease family protein [Mesorhizobium sp. M00.F.Ca.ET.216.01.1.1]|uniref:thermonuclease family protein n=1 Tax=Mesorhizobium sp. M00.F.Ca.ET.216.01.1.1 TaxID=2500528 RepID=UPI000FD9C57A|nr:thermonuclease family protein [Mesorhizobium sp. M00.F.Ca.ET.216.01.1.1]TGQ38665.1 thermonuclease family protein [Mesorhizobium sp. M00.F.Ca.ET.216.01.1.1]